MHLLRIHTPYFRPAANSSSAHISTVSTSKPFVITIVALVKKHCRIPLCDRLRHGFRRNPSLSWQQRWWGEDNVPRGCHAYSVDSSSEDLTSSVSYKDEHDGVPFGVRCVE